MPKPQNFATASAEVVFKLHENGEIDKDTMIDLLQKIINTAAEANGYVEEFGFPFPDNAD